MNDPDIQNEFWDNAAATKTFTHPVPWPVFRALIPMTARIIDYGCGYGRTCAELPAAGYYNVVGVDISGAIQWIGPSPPPADGPVASGRS